MSGMMNAGHFFYITVQEGIPNACFAPLLLRLRQQS